MLDSKEEKWNVNSWGSDLSSDFLKTGTRCKKRDTIRTRSLSKDLVIPKMCT